LYNCFCQILAAKREHTPNPSIRGEHTPDPSIRGEHTPDPSALEQQIDEMVYKLYGLTDDEIAIVEGKG
jgi:hypothetical protein